MGTITFKIPKMQMGVTLQEDNVKRALLEMNNELHFDLGAAHNIWHPYQASRQNVFYRGRSIVAMDRGTLPEYPVWSARKEMVEVPWAEVRYGEVCLALTVGVICKCLKCSSIFEFDSRPVGMMLCPMGCENIGFSTDATLWAWADKPVDKVMVFRTVNDRVILVGWRHTFWSLIRWGVPGVTRAAMESAFRVNLEERVIEELQVSEDIEDRILDRTIHMSA